MSIKENILESWIMVEHLSEGDIKLRDSTIHTFNGLQKDDYYSFFVNKLKQKKGNNRGIVVYFGIFSFDEIVDFFRETFDLEPLLDEVQSGDKFSLALYFDKDIKLNCEMTFLTESYYIKTRREIPKEKEFLKFESDKKKEIEEIFTCPENCDYKTFFNEAMQKVLNNYGFLIKNCRLKALSNIETEDTNLHSFFIADLEKAKSISTENLDSYLLGNKEAHVDLDSRVRSPKFNRVIIYDILQPKNYPLGRFPSNPEYALYFMQQIAVNLAIGYDNKQIRSVNGPPGTGKTTLLKDIFAELIVEQANDIAELSVKTMRGGIENRYWDKSTIASLPKMIAEKGITAVSSNNGAVQNIVNEMPLASQISDEFVEALNDVNYFKSIANSKVSIAWSEKDGKLQKELVKEPNEEPDKFWGLFSLEGGNKANMKYISTVLEHVVEELRENYTPDSSIYVDFKKQYQKVIDYRNAKQAIADKIKKMNRLFDQITKEKEQYYAEKELRKRELLRKCSDLNNELECIQQKLDRIECNQAEKVSQLADLNDKSENLDTCLKTLELQKPCFLQFRKRKKYNEDVKQYSDEKLEVLKKIRSIKDEISSLANEANGLKNDANISKTSLEEHKNAFIRWDRRQSSVLSMKISEAERLRKEIDGTNTKELDLSVDYRDLQLSNPWFDIEYRRLQTSLFISALKVRKQFLYDNIKNIKAAVIIWDKQNEHLEHKHIITEAWNWINMVIPVIGSTFASFGRMCANMDEESIGYLFIDEAGQATPQASVGAIFRSKQVMAVGDPSQIKPVLALDSSILSILREHYGVYEKYISEEASTQTLIDEISKYGFYKQDDKTDWIGIPLWVHRRCQSPMFDISNKISYGGNMVQAVPKNGKSEWYDCGGKAQDKYVSEQGEFLKEKIQKMIEANKDIIDRGKDDIIYVITPFRNVAYQLSELLKGIGFTRYENHKPTNVGTVHTFQGKEAPVVFLVLGADNSSKGAANWAMGTSNPNIMNVAATRAKKEFYIIGDKKLYLGLNSDVINDAYTIIEEFNTSSNGGCS